MVARSAVTDAPVEYIIKGLEKDLGYTKKCIKINNPIIFATIW
jgi:hypothetical protein